MAEYDFDSRQLEIARKRKLAEILLSQQQPMRGQMTGRFYVPASPLQGLSNLSNTYFANKANSEADAQEQQLATDRRQALANTLSKASQLEMGTPDQQVNNNPMQPNVYPTKTIPGQAPSLQSAVNEYMKNPDTQQFGMQMMGKMTDRQTQIEAKKTELEIAQQNRLAMQSNSLENARLIASMNNSTKRDVAGLTPISSSAKTNEGEIDINKVKPSDLEAAYRYQNDGTLPPNMGRGSQGAVHSEQIRSITAQINKNLGLDPSDLRTNQLLFKANGGALMNLAKRNSQVGVNEKQFNFHADQAEILSKQVDRGNIPVINSWINNRGRDMTNNPKLLAFDLEIKSLVNEYAQIASGSMSGPSTDSEKQKAEGLLSAQQTPEGFMSVLNQMRKGAVNRMQNYEDETTSTISKMKSGQAKPAATSNATGTLSEDQKAELQALMKKHL